MKRKAVTKAQASKTDWERVNAMRDEDIDYTDIPPTPLEAFAKAALKRGVVKVEPKKAISLRRGSERKHALLFH